MYALWWLILNRSVNHWTTAMKLLSWVKFTETQAFAVYNYFHGSTVELSVWSRHHMVHEAKDYGTRDKALDRLCPRCYPDGAVASLFCVCIRHSTLLHETSCSLDSVLQKRLPGVPWWHCAVWHCGGSGNIWGFGSLSSWTKEHLTGLSLTFSGLLTPGLLFFFSKQALKLGLLTNKTA